MLPRHNETYAKLPEKAGWGGGDLQLKNINTGRLRPEVQPRLFPFIYHFGRKGTPFIYLLLKKVSFSHDTMQTNDRVIPPAKRGKEIK